MRSRLFALLLVAVLALSLLPAVSAQETTCFNLSADDCAFLQEAEANSANLTSFNLSGKFNLSVTGLGAFDPTMGDITVTADLNGPLMFDPAMMTAENPFGGLATALDMNFAVQGAGQDESLALSVVLKDGVAYVKDPTSGQWMGMSMADAMSMSGMPFDPSALMGDPSAALGGLGMGDMGELTQAAEALANIPGFIDYQRLADEDMMGQATYPFSLTIDFVPLLKSPDFAQFLTAAMAASGQAGTEGMSGEQLAMMIPMFLGESTATINVTTWYGRDDKFLHRFSFDIDADIDPSGFAALAGGAGNTTGAVPTSHIVVDLHLEFDVTEHNATFDIQVPEGATMVPMGGSS